MRRCATCGQFFAGALSVCPDDGGPLRSWPAEGAVLDGKYRLDSCLGRGGMGAVFRAVHLGLDKPCAVKVIHAHRREEEYYRRFRLEARALGRLEHPNILRVTDYGVDPQGGGTPYLVTEVLRGRTLHSLLADEGPLPLERAVPVLRAVARALDYAHSEGVLHRDLKPSNIYMVSDGGAETEVRILDFGLAKVAGTPRERPDPEPARPEVIPDPEDPPTIAVLGGGSRSVGSAVDHGREPSSLALEDVDGEPPQTLRGQVIGTPGYIATEILEGREATVSSDLYALAVVAFETLTGRRPHLGAGTELLSIPLEVDPFPPSAVASHLPNGIDQVLLPGLSREPGERPASAGDLVDRLAELAFRQRRARWRRREARRRIPMAMAAAVLAVIAAVLLSRTAVLRDLEHRTVDLRFAAAEARAPTAEVVLVAIDDATLDADPRALVERANELGTALEAVMAAGARGIAVDLLLPEQWRSSLPFARLILEHPEQMVLAALAARDDRILGPETLDPLTVVALGPDRAAALFAYVNLIPDADGVIRRFRSAFKDRSGAVRASFPLVAARILTGDPSLSADLECWIDHRVDWRRWPRVSWKDVGAQARQVPSPFADRLVILGTDFIASGDESFRVPHAEGLGDTVPGYVLHALAVETLVHACPIRRVAVLPVTVAAALGCSLSAGAVLLVGGALVRSAVPLLMVIAWVGLVAAAFARSGLLMPAVWPVVAVVAASGLALGCSRRLPAHPRTDDTEDR